MSKGLSTEPYKGVRDFFPDDMAVQQYIFDTWRSVVQRYGYEEYNASLLEPTELYASKTSEEIVNEQTYTFTDRGERSVTLRPEMTPTVARMIAARKRDLAFPVRWFSIPNCFRYERPQRGRTREFWQLNVDCFGASNSEADAELIAIAYDIMMAFGAQESDFSIRINNRALLANLPPEAVRLLDKKDKMSPEAFADAWKQYSDTPLSLSPDADTTTVIDALARRGINNVVFDPGIVRGFDYYTGTVFEIFDAHPENPRSLFGGGRYDNLLDAFGADRIPAVGFGLGDVIMRDFLETHALLPTPTSTTTVMLCPLTPAHRPAADTLATDLRAAGIAVAVYYGDKKIGDQIKIAEKKRIPHIIAIGDAEAASATYTLKTLTDGGELQGDLDTFITRLKQ